MIAAWTKVVATKVRIVVIMDVCESGINKIVKRLNIQ